MARLDYVEYEDASPELRALYDEIKRTRPKVWNIYRLLGNSPELLAAFLPFVRYLRQKAVSDPKLRELVVLTAAKTTGTRYVWAHHARHARVAGVSEEELRAISQSSLGQFDPATQVALRYAAEVAASGNVEDETFAALRRHFSPKEITEITMLSGAYVLVGRWLTSMQADLEPEHQDEPWGK